MPELTRDELHDALADKKRVWWVHVMSGDMSYLNFYEHNWDPSEAKWLLRNGYWSFYLNYWEAWGASRLTRAELHEPCRKI